MTESSRRIALAALPLALVCIGWSATRAPDTGEAVIRAMHDRYAAHWYHTLTFTQATTRRLANDSMVHETWYEKADVPGKLRIDIEPQTQARTIIFADDSIFVLQHDSVVRRLPGRNPLLILGFDVYRQPVERTIAELHDEGFDLGPVHDDTWHGRPVYVVGAKAGDLHSHQFWVDKERLVFVRMLVPSRADSTKTDETLFDDYRPLGAGWIAARVEAYVAGKLVQREEYSEIKADAVLGPETFRISR